VAGLPRRLRRALATHGEGTCARGSQARLVTWTFKDDTRQLLLQAKRGEAPTIAERAA